MSEVKLHIAGLDDFFSQAREAAREIDAGDLRERPAAIGFESMELLLKVLTANRWQLLRRLKQSGKSSIRQLAVALGRDYRGVHADVHALIDAGLIARDGKGLVSVPWEKITAEMAIDIAA
ncbi:HVO_A0114 family putative DNA-binding protein [Rhizobium sp. 21-4511-3d]